MAPNPTFLQVNVGLIPVLHYVHCNFLHTRIRGPSRQTNSGNAGAKGLTAATVGGAVMTDVWYLCIDHIRSLSPTDKKWAESKCKQTKQPRLWADWGLVPSLWAKFSRENGQTQQTPNNYPLTYTEAWNHTNSLSQEPELWVQFDDDCCHCGPMMVSLVMYLSVLFYHNELLKYWAIILRMICTAVIALKCFVYVCLRSAVDLFNPRSHLIALDPRLGVILAACINQTIGQGMKNLFCIIYGIGKKRP